MRDVETNRLSCEPTDNGEWTHYFNTNCICACIYQMKRISSQRDNSVASEWTNVQSRGSFGVAVMKNL